MNELESRERELAATLRETLERKAAQPDALLEAALAATRAQIAQKPRRQRHPWLMAAGGLALAASLAVVIVLPGGQPADPTSATADAMPVADDADPQFLEDMDVLVAMGERS